MTKLITNPGDWGDYHITLIEALIDQLADVRTQLLGIHITMGLTSQLPADLANKHTMLHELEDSLEDQIDKAKMMLRVSSN